jgi:hypothetical protein
MIASFVIGFVAGILALFAIALRYVDRKEPEAPNSIAAVGLPMNGSGTSIETSIDRDTLRRVLKLLENGIS